MRPIGLSLKPQVALLTLASVWKMQMMAIKKSGFGNRTSVLLLTRTGTLAKLLNLSVFHFPHLQNQHPDINPFLFRLLRGLNKITSI